MYLTDLVVTIRISAQRHSTTVGACNSAFCRERVYHPTLSCKDVQLLRLGCLVSSWVAELAGAIEQRVEA